MLITISRQFGAGGSEVAQAVARRLGWTVLDDELVNEIAARSGLTPEEVASLDERTPSFVERLARSNAFPHPDMLIPAPELIDEPEEAKLARITREVISDLGRRKRLVLVGRSAAAILARQEDVLHVRLVAGREFRTQVAIERRGVDAADAARVVEDTDRTRRRFHREFYGRDWDDPTNYHMVLNTERLGFEGAAGVIAARARELGWANPATAAP